MLRKTIGFLISFILAAAAACSPAPLPISTATITPTAPIASPIITLVLPTSTPDFSAYKTRVAQQDQKRINELLMTNAGCDLPCWWGIKPGLTTPAEADKLMKELGAFGSVLENQEFRLPDGSLARYVGFDRFNSSESIDIGFGIQNNIIQSIHIERNVTIKEENIARMYWSAYSLHRIFKKYGKPDRIWVQNYPPIRASDTKHIRMFVFYDVVKFFMIYSLSVPLKDPIRICPTFEDGQIGRFDLYIISSSQEITLDEYVGGVLDGLEYILPIEEVSGLSVSSFYELILSKNGCFETRREIWH
jgi:hypothetical protein